MDTNDKFTYTITAYDADARTLDVSFSNGTWARITFRGSMPKSVAELDSLVAQYAPHVENVAAWNDDDTFVRSVIGQSRVAARFRSTPPEPEVSKIATPQAQEAVAEVALDDEAWVAEVVRKVLKEEGLVD